MQIIVPTPTTDAEFVSCTVPEADHPEWSAATAYVVGDKAMIAATHKTYEALTAHTNKPPAANPADWLDLGSTNRWRMFDAKVGTVTSATTTFEVVIEPGVVTALALIGCEANTVMVRITDPVEGVVYSKTVEMSDPTGITSWWDYFHRPVRNKPTLILTDLPSYGSAQVSVTLASDTGDTVSLGSLVVGRIERYAQSVNSGASAGIYDYSRKEKDEFGNWQIVERAFAKRASWSLVLDRSAVDGLQATLASLRAKPAVYLGGGEFDATVIYGFFRDFSIVIQYAYHATCSIEIEGLT